ncbi:MAG: Type 1 glutamine amidotransferase-like domain-containing protein [Oscillospiraceae bacterium]|jgi:peptidase E|nr:Type 1 glutamine amidotransferase-like domain-containing protein [Oscillospiraceae bacterium]
MDYRLLGFFSGFPSHSFPRDVAERLREELTQRDSLIFVSAWPAEHAKNDRDAVGMHGMFDEAGLPFAQYHVIDDRTEPSHAARLIHEASCVFLMGGHPGLQLRFLRETGLDVIIRETPAVVLGVSAGAINMARRSLDTKESPVPYEGLGLADITVKPHFELENRQVLSTLLRISMDLPICAMEDDSAIFVAGGRISGMGQIHWIHKGKICPLRQGGLSLRL